MTSYTEEELVSLCALHERMRQAERLGWKFEDTGITPGIMLMGCRKPGGEIAGIVGYVHAPRHVEQATKMLDELGVPQWSGEEDEDCE